MTKEQEQRLIAKARLGSEAAFEELVLENQKIVYNLALKNLGNPDDALDVSQEVFIKAYSALKSFRGDSRFSVWLYRLTQNACIDFVRKERSAKTVSLCDDDGEPADIPDGEPTPEEIAEADDMSARIRDAIDALPQDKRQVILMREFAQLSYGEMAKALGTSEGTVKSRISRAREALAQELVRRGTYERVSPSKEKKGGDIDE